MYQLHIANKNYSSWSLRPWILMKELDIPFKEVVHPFGVAEDWDSYKTFNSSGLVPCLENGNEIIWDSLAIIEFLAEKHRNVWPGNDSARHWARSAASEMHSGFFSLRENCSMNCGLRIKLSQVSPSLRRDVSRIDALWQTGLNKFGGPFLAGSKFTAVDAFYTPVAFRFQTYGFELSAKSLEYMNRLLSLDSMQLWYEQALMEPYRDAPHESDAAACGETTADYRRA